MIKPMMAKKNILRVASFSVLLGMAQSASASGFQILEQSVSSLGNAYAGSAALAEDASTNYYNAAGMGRVKNTQVVASAIHITSDTTLTIERATNFAGQVDATSGTTKPQGKATVPGFHLVKPWNDRLSFGFGVTSPYGLSTEYGSKSPARHMGSKTQLITVNMSPSVSYQFSDWLAVGAGPDVMKADVDFNAVLQAGGLAAGDGFQINQLRAWGTGWHAGVLLTPTDCLRLGLTYRSSIAFKGKGDRWTRVHATAATTNTFIEGNLTLPETAVASAVWDYSEFVSFLGDVAFTRWSRFDQIRLQDVTTGAVSLTPEDFKDTFRYSFGANFNIDDNVVVRLGTTYDQTPTHSERRTVRIPDSDRIWAAAGLRYKFSRNTSFDFGYAYLRFRHTRIDEVAPLNGAGVLTNGQTFKGQVDNTAHIMGIQLTWNFV